MEIISNIVKSIGCENDWCKKRLDVKKIGAKRVWTVPKIVQKVQSFYDPIFLPETVEVDCILKNHST